MGFPQAGSTQLPPDPLGRARCINLTQSGILLATTGQSLHWFHWSCVWWTTTPPWWCLDEWPTWWCRIDYSWHRGLVTDNQESDLDSIRNSCDVCISSKTKILQNDWLLRSQLKCLLPNLEQANSGVKPRRSLCNGQITTLKSDCTCRKWQEA